MVLKAASAQPVDSLLVHAKRQLRQAMLAGSAEVVLAVRSMFERATADGNLAILGHYFAGYSADLLVSLLSSDGSGASRAELLAYLDYAIVHLEQAKQRDPSFADEGWVLLAGVYGRKIGLRPLSGMRLGPRSSQAQEAATRLEPDYPRVALLQAVSDYTPPRIWGAAKPGRRRDSAGLHACLIRSL